MNILKKVITLIDTVQLVMKVIDVVFLFNVNMILNVYLINVWIIIVYLMIIIL